MNEPEIVDAVPRPRGSYVPHLVFFLLSSGVIVAAAGLRIRGEAEVLWPGTSVAMPGACTFKRFTGIDCPGCGLTRCFICLMHGEFARAWSYNPAGIVFFGVVAFQVPFRGWQLWRLKTGRDEFQLGHRADWVIIGIAGLLLTQWAIRRLAEWL